MNFLLVAIGGGIGALARYSLGLALVGSGVAAATGLVVLPTFIANVCGSFLIGFLSIFLPMTHEASVPLKSFLMTGMLGGFTTFSSFSLETIERFEQGLYLNASVNVLASVVVCLAAASLGRMSANALFGRV